MVVGYEGKARFQMTVNVWYDSLISGDASARVAGSLTVTGVLRALGLASEKAKIIGLT